MASPENLQVALQMAIENGDLCAKCKVIINDEYEGYLGADGYRRYCRDCGGKPNNGQLQPQEKRPGDGA